VTDANLVLGRLRPEQRFGETVAPNMERARAALSTLSHPEEAAISVVDVVNANMARAVRRVSLERGHDTREFTLVAFGGAGPLHACALAAELGFASVLIPRYPGVLSALGMLTAPEAVEEARGLVVALNANAAAELRAAVRDLESTATRALKDADAEPVRVLWSGDTRYQGQAHELRVAVAQPTVKAFVAAFHAAHERRFGYSRPEAEVELVTLRARAEAEVPRLDLSRLESGNNLTLKPGRGPLVVDRTTLAAGDRIYGAATIVQADATTYLPVGWLAVVDGYGNLVAEQA
jgi:N-methylhydantoinase A